MILILDNDASLGKQSAIVDESEIYGSMVSLLKEMYENLIATTSIKLDYDDAVTRYFLYVEGSESVKLALEEYNLFNSIYMQEDYLTHWKEFPNAE